MADWFRYAAQLGVNPWHPDTWPSHVRDEVARWRLAQFRAHWRWMQARDMPALMRAQSGRAYLIAHVRADLAAARRPLPRNPYAICPCHPQRLGLGQPAAPPRTPGVPAVLAALSSLRTFGGAPDAPMDTGRRLAPRGKHPKQ